MDQSGGNLSKISDKTPNISHRFHDKWGAKYNGTGARQLSASLSKSVLSNLYAYSFTKAPSYFWAVSVDLRNVLCQLCPRFKTRWIIQFSFSIFAIIHHRDTRKHPDHGSWLTSQCLVPHPSHPLESWQSQSSRMSGWCDLCIELWILCVGISSCFSEAFETKMWAMLWERAGERRRIIEKVTNDPSQIVQMTFISVCLREF